MLLKINLGQRGDDATSNVSLACHTRGSIIQAVPRTMTSPNRHLKLMMFFRDVFRLTRDQS